MTTPRRNPRVLVVTPEVTYLPDRMGNLAAFFTHGVRAAAQKESQ